MCRNLYGTKSPPSCKKPASLPLKSPGSALSFPLTWLIAPIFSANPCLQVWGLGETGDRNQESGIRMQATKRTSPLQADRAEPGSWLPFQISQLKRVSLISSKEDCGSSFHSIMEQALSDRFICANPPSETLNPRKSASMTSVHCEGE